MNPAAAGPSPAAPRRRWRGRLPLVVGAIVLVIVLALRFVAQPERTVPLILERLGDALGLEITASGRPELHLLGTPTLVVRGLSARQPAASEPLLTADRVLLALPWATVRGGGEPLVLDRVELDGAVLSLPALRRWLRTRPPGESRVPTLRDGLHIRDGIVRDVGWRVHGIDATLPRLRPGEPLLASVRGRFSDQRTAMPFDLWLAMSAPAARAGVAVVGQLEIERPDWRLPARIHLSGPLQADDDGLRVAPARLAVDAEYVTPSTRRAFVLGAHGPLRFRQGTWALAPAGVALRGEAPIPRFDGLGAVAFGQRLVLRLDGRLPGWPAGWPALPPPLDASDAPVALALDYVGAAGFSDVTDLRLARDATRFDARFRLPDVLAWIDDGALGNPLPPLTGTARAQRLQVSGAELEGVEISISDPGVSPPLAP